MREKRGGRRKGKIIRVRVREDGGKREGRGGGKELERKEVERDRKKLERSIEEEKKRRGRKKRREERKEEVGRKGGGRRKKKRGKGY